MAEIYSYVAREVDQDLVGTIVAAPARRISAADLANQLLLACSMYGIDVNTVLDLIHISASGLVYTNADPAPLTQSTSDTSTEQQSLPEHDQSPFK